RDCRRGIGWILFPAQEGIFILSAIPGLPDLSERLRRASEGPAQYIRRGCPASGPGSPSQHGSVTPRQPRTSFLGGKGGICDGENVNGFLGRGPTAGPGPATDRPAIPVLSAAGGGRGSRGVRGPDGRQ